MKLQEEIFRLELLHTFRYFKPTLVKILYECAWSLWFGWR